MHLNASVRQPGILKEMEIPDGFRLNGWVYILSNECMPGIYKIGMTNNHPSARAKELSSASGVPVPFKVEATFHCDNASSSEADIHASLSDCRVNESREFFKEDLEELIAVCEGETQANATSGVQALADRYDIISFESLGELNLPALFDDINVNVFGDRLAIAERLIRIGAELVREKLNKFGCSIVFSDDKTFAIMGEEQQWQEEAQRDHDERHAKKVAYGIYGPQQIAEF
ncbi:GIY-YIG nuclease family protein [Serratia fonticola]|uniref:GIY-YIG nuclease family protein n=1 Tax=Serratia fonticola TaxID=47917 RepID=UPI0015C606C4|nr:GIY-YIG nuclease family protein [Serratia fonticola]NYA42938.1 GIY-YIG nuclease family protein [Serratia fonticola]